MSAAEKFAETLSALCSDVRDRHGRLVEGKLSSLILQGGSEGWQAIASFRDVEKWNVSEWTNDPVAALLDVLMLEPEVTVATEPLDLSTGDLDELLV